MSNGGESPSSTVVIPFFLAYPSCGFKFIWQYFSGDSLLLGKQTISGQYTYTTIGSLDPNTEYKFRVQAVNDKGSGPLSSAATATTSAGGTVPGFIPTLTPGSITSSSVYFSWAAPR